MTRYVYLGSYDDVQKTFYKNSTLTMLPLFVLITFTLRLSQVTHLLLDLDPHGGTDPLGMFPLFLKGTADVLASLLV